MCVFAKGASCIDAQTDCTRRQLSFFWQRMFDVMIPV